MPKVQVRLGSIITKNYKKTLGEGELFDCEIVQENKSTVVIYVPLINQTITVKKRKLVYK